jgi:hypothetical protein
MNTNNQQRIAEKRRSPRHERMFRAILEYHGKVCEIKTINISQHGVLFPIHPVPAIKTAVKLTLIVSGEPSVFEGMVKRHARCLSDGFETIGVGIEFLSPEYQEFVQDKIIIASADQ